MDPVATDLWMAFQEAESTVGPEKAALMSYRPADAAARGDSAGKGDDFSLLEPIGRGGMGAVFKAVQTAFGREVAIKRANSERPELARQFLSEARITGILDHANIPPVHLIRTPEDGPPEIVMKLVRGAPWSELLHGAG